MPVFTSHAPGTPSWVDLLTPDIDGAIAFYTSVFGWDADEQLDPEGNRVYVMLRQDGKAVAGLGGQPPGMPEGTPAVWNTYISVADVAATAEAVQAAGGSVVMPPMQVFTSGHMAVFADRTGAAFSVWQAMDHIGAEIGNEPNTYSWNELMTRDVDTALEFYTKVFGWSYDTMDMPNGAYHVIAGGENGGLGGLLTMPPDVPEQVPNHWMAYFTVADIDATVASVQASGGMIAQPPFDIPGVGRCAVVHDPANGTFSLLQPAPE